MNKGELVDVVAEKANITKKEADAIISATIETIMESVAGDDKVTLVGFGSFEPRLRKAREGRNPRTGASVAVAEKAVPYFKTGKQLRDMMNG